MSIYYMLSSGQLIMPVPSSGSLPGIKPESSNGPIKEALWSLLRFSEATGRRTLKVFEIKELE